MATATRLRDGVFLSGLITTGGGDVKPSGGNGRWHEHWYIPAFPTAATDLAAADPGASANAGEEAQSSHAVRRQRVAPFKGRRVVESYDPATWPYPREEAAEREWDEAEE